MNAPPSLVCRELRLRQFRNFADLDLEFPPAGAAVIGPNGSGKTNLVEALYYLEIFRSFRGASDDQLIRFGGEAFHIRGRFQDPASGRDLEVTAAFEKRRRRKVVTVDGAEAERLGDALGRIGAVVFSPSDVAIVAGAPGERRRFLDIVLSLNVRGYLPALQRYRHTLRQRNALLRGGAPAGQLEPWTAGLVEAGAAISAARSRWVAEHRDGFADRYARIGGEAACRLAYRPSVSGTESPDSDSADALRAELDRLVGRERERGLTLAGPHRDDLAFLRCDDDDARDLRDFGSGGQQRTAAVSLRLVEAETIRRARGRAPIILLDDIFAELDPGRSARLLELLEDEPGQVILTAPKPSDVEVRHGALPRWRIAGGQIVAAA
ncbi:MAG TPA: DNA replication/repair protein RecF [Longimicrobiales bacterium]|nr:DNA replication/repair protein RecF [Longimicrobiales bacterium]